MFFIQDQGFRQEKLWHLKRIDPTVLDDLCRFIRVNAQDVHVTWEREGEIDANVVGFISSRRNLQKLEFLFGRTTRIRSIPPSEVIERLASFLRTYEP